MAKEQVSLVPSPEQLKHYQAIDPSLPPLLFHARDRELQREFIYAAMALGVAALALILVLGGFVYLVMQGHPTDAKFLLGAGVLGLIAGFLRARLRRHD
ncbi:MAG: hypothetical protein ACRD3N_18130 [Terracidiphilus sp.]